IKFRHSQPFEGLQNKSIRLLVTLTVLLCFTACENETAQALADVQAELAVVQEQLAAAKATNAKQAGMIHSVFFWLREDLTEAESVEVIAAVNGLREITHIKDAYLGPPAPTEERGVVDNSYNYALILHFDDVEAQNAYQIDPIHVKFVEENKDKWTKVVVYDHLVK
ncbi:MAG: Dabb family protein, partial [Bacteroidota bacterium]